MVDTITVNHILRMIYEDLETHTAEKVVQWAEEGV